MTPRLLPLLTLASALTLPSAGQNAASPFMPPEAANATMVSSGETIEFAGVIVGRKTDLIFYDKTLKKSRWVSLGETSEGIQAIRYDAERGTAEVRINGVAKTLPLRKSNVTAAAINPANPIAPVAPAHTGFNVAPTTSAVGASQPTPDVLAIQNPAANAAVAASQPGAATITPPATPAEQTIAKQEADARNLVSDLLEIGMAQRKAYEEAQRRQQQGDASPAK
jgi:hypothetical protein